MISKLNDDGHLVPGTNCNQLSAYSEIVAQFDRIIRDGFEKKTPVDPWNNETVREVVKAASEAGRLAGIDKLPKMTEKDQLNEEAVAIATKIAAAVTTCFTTKFKDPQFKVDESLVGPYAIGCGANTVFWYSVRRK